MEFVKKKQYLCPWLALFVGGVVLMVCNRSLELNEPIIDLLATIFPIVMVGPIYLMYRKTKHWVVSDKSIVLLFILMAFFIGISSSFIILSR